MPVSGTLCGLPGASSVTARDALKVAAVGGVKEMLIWQFAPIARLAGQLFV